MTRTSVLPPEEATRRVHLTYRPAVDGLRAVAVLAVLVYHGQPSWLPGGFLGVDVFFVISGFLITTLLVRERLQEGTIDLAGFWLRRARRLLPAIVLLVAAAGLYALVLAAPEELERIRRDGLSTLLYVNNWSQVLQGSSYFDAFTTPSPLRHAWSLAIEEQFYFVWPLVVLGALRLTRGHVRPLVPAALVLALASAVLMAVLAPADGDPTRAYYGTDTRAQGLLLGAAAAFLLHGRRLGPRAVRLLGALGALALAGLLAMALVVQDTDPWMYDGGFLLAAVLSAVVVAAAAQPVLRADLAGLALSLPPLPAIGRISYGLYLWHWPVDVVLTPARTGWDGIALFALRTTVAFLAAGLSYVLVERPVRLAQVQPARLLGGLATGAAATAAVVLLATSAAVPDPRTDLQAEAGEGDLITAMVGDSVAQGLAANVPDDVGRELLVRNGGIVGCGITPGEPRPLEETATIEGLAGELCDRRLELWDELVGGEQPADLAILVTGGHEVYAQEVDGEVLEPGTAAFAAFYQQALREDVAVLGAHGAQVVVLTAHCMEEEGFVGPGSPERNDPGRVRWLNDQVSAVAQDDPSLIVADLHAALCPGGDHAERVDGVELYRDGFHFTDEGAHVVWRWLVEELDLDAASPG